MSAPGHHKRSRRELFAGPISGASAARDRPLLAGLLDLEQLAESVYAQAGASSHLSPAARTLARRLGSHERSHAEALSAAIGTGATPGPDPSVTATEAGLVRHGISVRLATLTTERAWFTVLERTEAALEGAYYKALGQLRAPAYATLAAKILACEGQHATLLFSFRNPRNIGLDVSEPLVVGTAGEPTIGTGPSS